jgi:hypothetical protein
MASDDVRWHQRFANYRRASQQLAAGVQLGQQRPLTELERQGLVVDGELWMAMIRHRNLSTHTDDEATVNEIVTATCRHDLPALQQLAQRLAEQQGP